MRFEIHSIINNATATGITTKVRGILPELGCAGEIVLFDDKVAAQLGTTYNEDGTVAIEGLAYTKYTSKGLFPVVELSDEHFETAEAPNKDFVSKKTGEIKQDRLIGKEVFRIFPKTADANWLAKVLPALPMPRITTSEADIARF